MQARLQLIRAWAAFHLQLIRAGKGVDCEHGQFQTRAGTPIKSRNSDFFFSAFSMKLRTGKDKTWYGIFRTQEGNESPAYRVCLGRHGIVISKCFSTVNCGGEEGAFKAAQEWRDRVLALFPPMTFRQVQMRVRSSNSSGVPGVQRVLKSPGRAYWVAFLESDGKRQRRSFSIKIHGEEGARQMAIEARRQMLQTVPDRFWQSTEASRELLEQAVDWQDIRSTEEDVVRNGSAQQYFLERLRAEGLIVDKPAAPPVGRREYASMRGAIWEARHITPAGKEIYRRFSVARHGDQEAERLAWQAYERLKEEFSTDRPSPPPVRQSEQFDAIPDQLLDAVIRKMALKNDAALARTISVDPSVISKIRNRHLPVGTSLLVRLLKLTGLHIQDLYQLAQREIAC